MINPLDPMADMDTEYAFRSAGEWASEAKIEAQRWARGEPAGLSTGFKTLDTYFRLVPGEVTLVAARPGAGKTAFAMQIAESVARKLKQDGDPGVVAVYSAEMSGVVLMHRLAAGMANVNLQTLRLGKGTPEQYVLFNDALDRIKELGTSLFINDKPTPSTAFMQQHLERMKTAGMPARLMVFDYMELGGDPEKNEVLRLGLIANRLRAVCKRLKIPGLIPTQLNREVEKTPDKMPSMADMRFSGMLEQTADNILTIMRPEYYIMGGQRSACERPQDARGVAYIQFAKYRQGLAGMTLRMAFHSNRIRFADLNYESPDDLSVKNLKVRGPDDFEVANYLKTFTVYGGENGHVERVP